MKLAGFQRVNRLSRCVICGRGDWCLIADDGSAAICQRIESDRRWGGAGYFHRLAPGPDRPRARRGVISLDPAPDFGQFANECAAVNDGLGALSVQLGVSVESLRRLLCGWSEKHRAFAFPMRNADGRICGVRLRRHDGRKWAVVGGREGLFVPIDLAPGGRLLVCEGATDCAALLTLGLSALGRPSCTGGVRLICNHPLVRGADEVVVFADNDSAGQRGAQALASVLRLYCPRVRMAAPPAGVKDARAWVRDGATRGDMEAAIEAAPMLGIPIEARRRR